MDTPIRILVIEDDDTFLELLQSRLESLGCLVDTVSTVDEALWKLNNNTYHAITIDNNLPDRHGIEEEDEGQRLAYILHRNNWLSSKFPAVHSTVITQLAEKATLVVKMMRDYEVENYIIKDELRTAFQEGGAIHEMVEKLKVRPQVRIDARDGQNFKRSIQIDWAHYWAEDVVRFLPFQMAPPNKQVLIERMELEFDLLIQRLFPKADLVTLKPIQQGNSATKVFEAIITQNGNVFPRVIVKIGIYYKVAQEFRNYNEFVRGKISNSAINIQPDENGFARTQLFGGIVYSFVGGGPDTFPALGEYYATASAKDIEVTLENLLQGTTDFWYQTHNRRTVSLYKLYDEVLKLTKYQAVLRRALTELEDAGMITVYEDMIDFQLTEHGKSTFYNILRDLQRQPAPSLEQFAMIGVVHGDMNENNVRVEPASKRGWLIDFQQTGHHHAMQDFVQLETVVMLYLLDIGSDLDNFYHLQQHLLSNLRLDNASLDYLRDSYNAPNEAYAKACNTVIHIRRIVGRKIHDTNNTYADYFMGLLLFYAGQMRYTQEAIMATRKLLEADKIIPYEAYGRINRYTMQLGAALLAMCLLGRDIEVY